MSLSLLLNLPRTRHPLYQTWYGMLSRCEKPTHVSFRHYGARGVVVCDEWHDFEEFVRDVGMPPTRAHTLDRFPNPAGNYEPGNVRWATNLEQGGNRVLGVRLPKNSQETSGLASLRMAMIARNINCPALARLLGVSHPSAWQWLKGTDRPQAHYRVAIERLLSIPASDWMTDAEFLLAYGHARP